MSDVTYADAYRGVDFRKNPEKYRVGKGEQGVLIAEPYKSEILPHWRFANPEKARASAEKIYELFISYKSAEDFVGMDMARKFLQMGFTRARRYANHASGKKYDDNRNVKAQDEGSETSEKAEAARIFYEYYSKAKNNPYYIDMQTRHKRNYESAKKR